LIFWKRCSLFDNNQLEFNFKMENDPDRTDGACNRRTAELGDGEMGRIGAWDKKGKQDACFEARAFVFGGLRGQRRHRRIRDGPDG
jgi:hypothetical protein